MWLSEKHKARDARAARLESLREQILGLFDFGASEAAEPFHARASDILTMLGAPAGKWESTVAGKVLKEMVGPNVACRRNGVFGRWYAMPPLRQRADEKDLLA